jgi:hypothetical protein
MTFFPNYISQGIHCVEFSLDSIMLSLELHVFLVNLVTLVVLYLFVDLLNLCGKMFTLFLFSLLYFL